MAFWTVFTASLAICCWRPDAPAAMCWSEVSCRVRISPCAETTTSNLCSDAKRCTASAAPTTVVAALTDSWSAPRKPVAAEPLPPRPRKRYPAAPSVARTSTTTRNRRPPWRGGGPYAYEGGGRRPAYGETERDAGRGDGRRVL